MSKIIKLLIQEIFSDNQMANHKSVARVIGYLSNVGGWNERKRQELEDRNTFFNSATIRIVALFFIHS